MPKLDEIRRQVIAHRQRLDAARAAIKALTDDERATIYVELEEQISETVYDAPAPKRRADEPKFGDLVEKVLRDHPHGLRMIEVARKVNRSIQHTYEALKQLEEQERAERHGERMNTLWTLPGVVPPKRPTSLRLAMVHLLTNAKGPMDADELRDGALRLVAEYAGRRPLARSAAAELSKLVASHVIATDGANEHGPLYVLVPEDERRRRDEDEDLDAEEKPRTLN